MKCYKCGNFLYENDFCAECGADVSKYKHIVKRSNELYNRGLEMARNHNLSGAIDCLRVSLKMYKANTNARNLLGLVYVEMGEYAMGLAQWVVSKSQQSENNMADHFLEELQNTRQDLHLMNFTIRKYNKAVAYVSQGNYDLAEIQLKKLLNENTHVVKAYQLLALLLMRKKKYAEARNVLRKAIKVDRGNPVTIAYSAQVEEEIKEEEAELTPTELRNKRLAERNNANSRSPLSGDDVIIPKSSYREYNPATMTILQILIGVIVGAAIVFFIVMPAKTKTLRNEYQTKINDLNAKLEQYNQEDANGVIKESDDEGNVTIVSNTEDKSFSLLIDAQIANNNSDFDGALNTLSNVNESVLSDTQKQYYNSLKSYAMTGKYQGQVEEAVNLYNSENYQGAKDKLQAIYDAGYRNAWVLYFLGRSYDWLDDRTNAEKYLKEYVTSCPGDPNVETANQILNAYAS